MYSLRASRWIGGKHIKTGVGGGGEAVRQFVTVAFP